MQQSQEEKPTSSERVIPLEAKKVILQAMQDLRRMSADPQMVEVPLGGICCNALQMLQYEFEVSAITLTNLLNSLFITWPKHSGNTTYPIEGGKEKFNFSDANEMWGDSAYGKLRKELLDHSIAELQKQI